MLDIAVIGGIIFLAFIAELIDSSLGMMYGTLLSPILILLGFDPLVIVPSILFSQAIGGFIAAVRHHHFGNADFNVKSEDFRSFLVIVLPGMLAVIAGSYLAVSIPKYALKLYIGFLVLLVGLVVVLNIRFRFSWMKMGMIGLVSAFNKAMSGGGFGPFVTAGQVAIGQKSKNSIGITTLAEVPIALSSFIAYLLLNGISDWLFVGMLTAGAILGALIGPKITQRFDEKSLKSWVGVIVFILGAFLVANVLGLIEIKGFGA